MYNFLFDKKSLVLVLSGMAAAGGLLFFGGVLVGVQWGLPMGGYTAPASAPMRAALPAERPCKPEPEAVPVPASPEPPAPEPVEPEPQQVFASVAPARLEARPVEKAVQEPEPPAPAPQPEPAVLTSEAGGRYSLQIGAFKRPENSAKVIQALQSRGYEPYVIEQKGRSVLRTVRIGRYADRTEALRAASDFRRREGMEAIVRPLGS